MKKTFTQMVAGVLLFATGSAMARDTVLHLPFSQVLEMPEARSKLDSAVKFYLDGVSLPSVTKKLGSGVSNRKTNGAGKSDEYGCRWAALSALLAFQESAKRQGANAVINIVSYYKKHEFKSSSEYECHAGGLIIGVALKGEYAVIDK
jgi:uncharacterized protein YbjQ (UPF0145 family)